MFIVWECLFTSRMSQNMVLTVYSSSSHSIFVTWLVTWHITWLVVLATCNICNSVLSRYTGHLSVTHRVIDQSPTEPNISVYNVRNVSHSHILLNNLSYNLLYVHSNNPTYNLITAHFIITYNTAVDQSNDHVLRNHYRTKFFSL